MFYIVMSLIQAASAHQHLFDDECRKNSEILLQSLIYSSIWTVGVCWWQMWFLWA